MNNHPEGTMTDNDPINFLRAAMNGFRDSLREVGTRHSAEAMNNAVAAAEISIAQSLARLVEQNDAAHRIAEQSGQAIQGYMNEFLAAAKAQTPEPTLTVGVNLEGENIEAMSARVEETLRLTLGEPHVDVLNVGPGDDVEPAIKAASVYTQAVIEGVDHVDGEEAAEVRALW
jgi:hypothetical protein